MLEHPRLNAVLGPYKKAVEHLSREFGVGPDDARFLEYKTGQEKNKGRVRVIHVFVFETDLDQYWVVIDEGPFVEANRNDIEGGKTRYSWMQTKKAVSSPVVGKATKLILEVDARGLGRPVSGLSDAFLDRLQRAGIGIVWLKAPWEKSYWSYWAMKHWQEFHGETVERWPSGYVIYQYKIAPDVARSENDFRRFARRLKKRGIALIVDFVTNHLAADSPEILTVPGLTIAGDEQDYLRAMRTEFRDRTGDMSDMDLSSMLDKENHWDVRPEEIWKGHYYRHPADPRRIVRHAQESPFGLPMLSNAQLNLLDPRAREYMIQGVLKRIAGLTLNGGVRADLSHLGLREHIRRTWGWTMTDAEFAVQMPREFGKNL